MSPWPHSSLHRPARYHVTNADIDLFGRRLRLGEPVVGFVAGAGGGLFAAALNQSDCVEGQSETGSEMLNEGVLSEVR